MDFCRGAADELPAVAAAVPLGEQEDERPPLARCLDELGKSVSDTLYSSTVNLG